MQQYKDIKITKEQTEPKAKAPLKRKSDELDTIMCYYYKKRCEEQQETIADYKKQLAEVDARATRLLGELVEAENLVARQHRRAAYFSMFTNEHNQNSQLVNLFEQLQAEMMQHGHIMEALHLQDRVEAITSQGNIIDLTLADTEVDTDTD